MTVSTTLAPAAQPVISDRQLISKLSQSGPRYTSYPTADRFTETFGYRDYLQAVASVRTRGGRHPVSLYLHIPFCDTVCYYCACNKIDTKNRNKAAIYLSYLKQEIALQGQLFFGMNQVEQLHVGGGTPTYLSDAQMDGLMQHLRRWFAFAPDALGEYSIEVDPRTLAKVINAQPDRIALYHYPHLPHLFKPQPYSQDAKTLDAYYAQVDCGQLPVVRGIKRTMNNVIRRTIIQMLMCNSELSTHSLEQAYPITFSTYLASEIVALRELADLGLLSIDDEWISVSLKGRQLIRNICMVFDRYLQPAHALGSDKFRYSQTD